MTGLAADVDGQPVDGDSELTCQELVELVTDYLEGALPAAERERFDDHLEGCDPCVEYVAQLRLTVGALGRLPATELEPAIRDHLLEHFRAWTRQPADGAASR